MTKAGWVLTTALFVGVLSARPARSQEDQNQAEDQWFWLTADVGMEFTDNRDSSRTEESNWEFWFSPRLNAGSVEWGGLRLDGYYAPSYRYRTDPALSQEENAWHHAFELDLAARPTPRLRVRASDTLRVGDNPAIQRTGLGGVQESEFIYNAFSGDVRFGFLPRTTLQLWGNHSLKHYTEEAWEADDEERLWGSAALWQQLSPGLAVLAMADILEYGYDTSFGTRDFTLLTAGGGIEAVLNANLRLGGRLQWEARDYEEDNIPDSDEPRVDVSLRATTIPSTRLKLQASRQTRDSDVIPFASQDHTEFSAEIEWEASSAVTLGLTAAYRLGEYEFDKIPRDTPVFLTLPNGQEIQSTVGQQPAAAAQQFPTGDEDKVSLQARVVLAINDTTSLKLSQRFEDTDSDVSEPYTRNTTRLVLTRQF